MSASYPGVSGSVSVRCCRQTAGSHVWPAGCTAWQGRQKIGLAKTFNDFGLDLMLCDVDVVWIKDPTHFFNLYPEADILTSR